MHEVCGMGQEKLLKSKVLVVGAGGLGSPAVYYLAAAGVGTIGIVDFDVVDFSNLQRQILHNKEGNLPASRLLPCGGVGNSKRRPPKKGLYYKRHGPLSKPGGFWHS